MGPGLFVPDVCRYLNNNTNNGTAFRALQLCVSCKIIHVKVATGPQRIKAFGRCGGQDGIGGVGPG